MENTIQLLPPLHSVDERGSATFLYGATSYTKKQFIDAMGIGEAIKKQRTVDNKTIKSNAYRLPQSKYGQTVQEIFGKTVIDDLFMDLEDNAYDYQEWYASGWIVANDSFVYIVFTDETYKPKDSRSKAVAY